MGNTFTDVDPTEYTYVNVWFRLKDGVQIDQLNKADGEKLIFDIIVGDFCNWMEETVTVATHETYVY